MAGQRPFWILQFWCSFFFWNSRANVNHHVAPTRLFISLCLQRFLSMILGTLTKQRFVNVSFSTRRATHLLWTTHSVVRNARALIAFWNNSLHWYRNVNACNFERFRLIISKMKPKKRCSWNRQKCHVEMIYAAIGYIQIFHSSCFKTDAPPVAELKGTAFCEFNLEIWQHNFDCRFVARKFCFHKNFEWNSFMFSSKIPTHSLCYIALNLLGKFKSIDMNREWKFHEFHCTNTDVYFCQTLTSTPSVIRMRINTPHWNAMHRHCLLIALRKVHCSIYSCSCSLRSNKLKFQDNRNPITKTFANWPNECDIVSMNNFIIFDNQLVIIVFNDGNRVNNALYCWHLFKSINN